MDKNTKSKTFTEFRNQIKLESTRLNTDVSATNELMRTWIGLAVDHLNRLYNQFKPRKPDLPLCNTGRFLKLQIEYFEDALESFDIRDEESSNLLASLGNLLSTIYAADKEDDLVYPCDITRNMSGFAAKEIARYFSLIEDKQ